MIDSLKNSCAEWGTRVGVNKKKKFLTVSERALPLYTIGNNIQASFAHVLFFYRTFLCLAPMLHFYICTFRVFNRFFFSILE